MNILNRLFGRKQKPKPQPDPWRGLKALLIGKEGFVTTMASDVHPVVIKGPRYVHAGAKSYLIELQLHPSISLAEVVDHLCVNIEDGYIKYLWTDDEIKDLKAEDYENIYWPNRPRSQGMTDYNWFPNETF